MKTLIAISFIGWLACFELLAREPAANPAPSGTALFQAIRVGDHPAVRTLLKNGAAVNPRDELGNTPLMAAALNADAAVLELLLKAGADVNATNQAGATPLMRAATFEDKVRLLVAKRADVKARSRFGNTALMLAARKPGNSRAVKLLLDHGADPNAANVLGATALMAAAAAADSDSVRALLDRGADVNAKPNMDGGGFVWGGGRTALMWAAFQGNESLARLLLERGAKVNEITLGGGPLTQAGWGGHAGVARLLLDFGAPVDQRDLVANYTPLHWAASSERSSPSLVKLLLERGADANAEGGQSVDNFLGATQTPLSLARKRGDTPIVQALLKAGAKDTPAPVRSGKTTDQTSGASGAKTIAEAIQRALPPLTKTAEESVSTYLRHASKQDCIACHQQQLPLAAISLAESRHFATDREVTRHQVELVIRSFFSDHFKLPGQEHNILEMDWQTTFHPEPAIFDGYVSLDLSLQHQPASEVTDSMVHQLATIQHPDGHWSWNLPRPPIQASDITATAQAVYSIQSYPIPALRQELDSRVKRARAWLAKARAETNEERVHQLLGLAWAGEKPGTLKKLAEELIRQQRADGGWGQLAGLDSDAYGTGQSLYALMEGGGIPSGDPALRRGVDFLLRTQLPDGTWHVRTRTHPFQPPMHSGFPHGKDGWISSAGTSWAVMALATSLDPKQTPGTAGILDGVSKPAPLAGTDASAPRFNGPVEFTRDIQPLLERSCVACHSGEKPKGGFTMSDRASLLKGGNRGEPAVVPGKPDAGQLIHFVQDQVEDLEMPPVAKRGKFPALTKDEITKLSGWIAQGANWPQGATLHAPEK
ncbi:MAG: ankyrin repeat domain-containing protein [Verrucomicrobia bacterium]|nr:ankyrin repeat domain-containing protein [Verrucomicrobiota bacterium]